MPLKLNVIIGSTRPGRAGPVIGRWVADFSAAHGGFDVDLVDLSDFDLPLLDEAAHPIMQQYAHVPTQRWAASVDVADAYLFVTPEYDYFPPAALVNAVQVVMREWGRKPAGVVSYGGISGGLRAAQQLRLLVSTLNVHALPNVVPVPNFAQYVDETGTFQPSPPIAQGLTGLLDELNLWAKALKPIRAAV